MSDRFIKIFLAVCKHLGLSVAAAVLYGVAVDLFGLWDEATSSGLLVVLAVVNCTGYICGKLNDLREWLEKGKPAPQQEA